MRDIPSYSQAYSQSLDARSAAIAAARADPSKKDANKPRIHITGLTPAEAKAQAQAQSQDRSPSKHASADAASVLTTSTFASTISLIKSGLHHHHGDETRNERKAREKEEKRRSKEDSKSPSKAKRSTAESYLVIGMLK